MGVGCGPRHAQPLRTGLRMAPSAEPIRRLEGQAPTDLPIDVGSLDRRGSTNSAGSAWIKLQAVWVSVLLIILLAASQSSVGERISGQAKSGFATCFLNEIQHPRAAKIAEATVFIAALRSDGTLASEGTGFVVSDSADGSARGLRIVTAAHVIDDPAADPEGGSLVVFFSDGMPLGVPRTVIRGATRELTVGGFALVENDLAVLEISSFYEPSARARYLELPGLPLAGNVDILVGESSRPLGASWGFSGAAAIDPDGRVVGVLTDADFRDRATLELGSIIDANQNSDAAPRRVVLPARSLDVIEPLHDPNILRALGRSAELRESTPATTVTLAGFPSASCAAISATVEPIDSGAGTELVSRWTSMGMEGAWYLPPQFDTRKLLSLVNSPKAAAGLTP